MAGDKNMGYLGGVVKAPIDRRSLIARGAAVSAAGFAAASLGSPAIAAIDGTRDRRLSTFEGAYAIHGGSIVNGYFAKPRANMNALDVVVVVHGPDGLDARAKSIADRVALGGKIAIAPNLPTTWGKDTAGLGHDAMVAKLLAVVPNLKHLPRGTGRVSIVAGA